MIKVAQPGCRRAGVLAWGCVAPRLPSYTLTIRGGVSEACPPRTLSEANSAYRVSIMLLLASALTPFPSPPSARVLQVQGLRKPLQSPPVLHSATVPGSHHRPTYAKARNLRGHAGRHGDGPQKSPSLRPFQRHVQPHGHHASAQHQEVSEPTGCPGDPRGGP